MVVTRWSFIAAWLLSSPAVLAEVVVSDDGRQIQLNADGTWVQLSRDRFATTITGERIRLKPDGSWNYLARPDQELIGSDERPIRSQENAPPQPDSRTFIDEPVLMLGQVEILRRVVRRAKSKHADNIMRFELKIRNATAQNLLLPLPAELPPVFTARDGRRGNYAVIAVDTQYSSTVLAPGDQASYWITVKDSPQWYGIKHLSLEVAANTFGNTVPRLLVKPINEVLRREVDAF